MYITDLTIREFRCIARGEVRFQHPDSPDADQLEIPNVNLLTGLNGGGKSTILEAIVGAVLGEHLARAELLPKNLVRRDARGECRLDARVLTHAEDRLDDDADDEEPRGVQLGVRVQRLGRRQECRFEGLGHDRSKPRVSFDGKAHGFFLAAYGPTRRSDGEAQPPRVGVDGGLRVQRVASLFDEQVRLVPIAYVLRRSGVHSAGRREEIERLLARMIPPGTRLIHRRLSGGEVQFEQNEVALPHGALSAGLQSHIAWIADLLHHLALASPRNLPIDELPGIVLIDEVDQRLHPRWQQKLLSWLSAALPRLQFVVTSHSPLVASSLRPVNISVLEPHRDAEGKGAMRPRRMADDVFGRSADGVLTSSYFDLPSTRSDPFRRHLRGLVEQARRGDRDAPLQLMRVLGDPKRMRRGAPSKGTRT